MRLSYFLFYLINTLLALTFLILTIVYTQTKFFIFYNIIILFDFIYFFFMVIYSFKINSTGSLDSTDSFFRDVFFQIVFIFNGGLMVLIPILFLTNSLVYNKDYEYFFNIYLIVIFIIILIDSRLIWRTNGGYSANQIVKFSFIISIFLFFIQFIYLFGRSTTVKEVFLYFFYVMIVYFAGVGMYAFFLIIKPYKDITDFKKDQTTVITIA